MFWLDINSVPENTRWNFPIGHSIHPQFRPVASMPQNQDTSNSSLHIEAARHVEEARKTLLASVITAARHDTDGGQTASPRSIPGWPKQPRTIPTRSAPWKEILLVMFDFFLILLPLLFLLIAVLAKLLDQRPVDLNPSGQMIITANKYVYEFASVFLTCRVLQSTQSCLRQLLQEQWKRPRHG